MKESVAEYVGNRVLVCSNHSPPQLSKPVDTTSRSEANASWSAEARRLQAHAGVPQRVLFRRPVALVAPGLEVGLGAGRQEDLPCRLKPGAGFVQAGCGAAAAFARPGSRIEAAAPFPGGSVSCGLPMRMASVPACTSP